MSRFFLFFLILGISNIAKSQETDIIVDSIVYNAIHLPFLTDSHGKQNRVTEKINKQLQRKLLSQDTLVTKENKQLLKNDEFRHDEKDEDYNAGITSLTFSHKIHKNYIEIKIDFEGMGAYTSGYESYLYFDKRNGTSFNFSMLFKGELFFDFLNKFWINGCDKLIIEAHKCGEDSATLKGPCEFECYSLNERLQILDDSIIIISDDGDCYPHAQQACVNSQTKSYRTKEILPYLSDYGKWLFSYSSDFKPVEPFYHLVGKIDDKDYISMSLKVDSMKKVNGFYFYWSQKNKINLKGFITDSSRLIIDEYLNNKITGRFDFEWDDFKYSTIGTLKNSTSNKVLPVNMRAIYEYDENK